MKKLLVLYDSWCPLCIKIKKNIEYLDWFHIIEFQTIRNNDQYLDIPYEQLVKKMHCVELSNKKIHSGIDAVAAICLRIPLLFMFYFPLKFSSSIGIGEFVYNHIANSRRIVPVNNCVEDGCELIPNEHTTSKEPKTNAFHESK
ncbi:DUF393 domain-containing protein (plasmid) [Niallia sp. XMNu-256]|uniref:thiol-disulfide oxidoreductase DCC family protein n=1 Tax=Niallia sp. XMNu-256 TaxID=3082444 RepID=UPI0030D184E2